MLERVNLILFSSDTRNSHYGVLSWAAFVAFNVPWQFQRDLPLALGFYLPYVLSSRLHVDGRRPVQLGPLVTAQMVLCRWRSIMPSGSLARTHFLCTICISLRILCYLEISGYLKVTAELSPLFQISGFFPEWKKVGFVLQSSLLI